MWSTWLRATVPNWWPLYTGPLAPLQRCGRAPWCCWSLHASRVWAVQTHRVEAMDVTAAALRDGLSWCCPYAAAPFRGSGFRSPSDELLPSALALPLLEPPTAFMAAAALKPRCERDSMANFIDGVCRP